MITSYIKLRDMKNEMMDRHKTELKPINDGLGQIADYLLDYLKRQDLQSVSTKEATAFLKRERSATVADTQAFREYVISSKSFDLADFRAKKDAVEDYINEHDGQLPPGVNFTTAIIVGVQRK
jgi:hypothetical protein